MIRYAVWLYFRFTLSIRDVEELLAQRRIEVSREAVRCWVIKFGPLIAANLRRHRCSPTSRWHLDEMVVRIGRRRMYLWRAVDAEGEVLDVLVQKRRNKHAALKLLRLLLKNQGIHLETITTDKLGSYRAAARDLGLTSRHRPGGMRGKQPRRKLALGHQTTGAKAAEIQVPGLGPEVPSAHAAVYNCFNVQEHLIRRSTLRTLRAQAHRAWAAVTIAA